MIERPDGRRFVSFRDIASADYESHLAESVARSTGDLHANVDLADTTLVAACRAAGFATQFETQHYTVPFAGALSRIHRGAAPRGCKLVAADQVDPTELFRLDEQLRQDVPGTDGWVGNRDWFDRELASPEFDPTGYLVAVDTHTGALTGLVRFWKRAPRPSLGLLAVSAPRRSGYLAHALLRGGLEGASRWGFDSFGTHTARPALQRRLRAMDAEHTSTSAHMQRVHH